MTAMTNRAVAMTGDVTKNVTAHTGNEGVVVTTTEPAGDGN